MFFTGIHKHQRNTGKKETIPADEINAGKLHSIITEIIKYRKKWSRASWSQEMRILRQAVDGDLDRIQKALNWYADHARDRYTPVIRCAKSFRQKFPQLEQAIIRSQGNTAVISDEAKTLARKLAQKGWPKGSSEQLPQAIQTTMDGYSEFSRRFKLVYHKYKDDLPRWFIHYAASKRTTPTEFAEKWFADIHRQVRSWKDWSGKLKVFRYGDPEYYKMIFIWACNYGAPEQAKRLTEEIDNES